MTKKVRGIIDKGEQWATMLKKLIEKRWVEERVEMYDPCKGQKVG